MSRLTLVLSTAVAAAAAFGIAFAIARQRAASERAAERAPASKVLPGAATASAGLPVMWQLPEFSFRDQNDQPTSAADLRGNVVIADFVFTSCTTICPLITAKMALLQRRLPSEKLRFLSFSVDPARDTPEALKRYAASWRPGESRWTLLSTTPEGLESVASKMFVSVKPVENDIAHSNLFFLVDERGGVRGIYESDRNDAVERLVRDTEALLGAPPDTPSSKRKATTGSELYAALGCGACHARKELAPPLEKLLGRPVVLEGGSELKADKAYLRESIVAPDQKLVAGYTLRMPSYEKELTPRELDALVGHLVTFGGAAPSAQAPTESEKASTEPAAPTEPAKAAAEPAEPPTEAAKASAAPATAVDPVCSMSVRVVDTTPRATHAGRTVFFCSELCRERFLAEPARYVK
jgi:protein SCO1/2